MIVLKYRMGRGLTWTAGAAPGYRVGARRRVKLVGGPIVARAPKANYYHPHLLSPIPTTSTDSLHRIVVCGVERRAISLSPEGRPLDMEHTMLV